MSINIKDILKLSPEEQKITAEGWIRTKRDTGNLCFLEVNDGTCMKGLQVIAEKNDIITDEIIDSISTGASVIAEGTLVESPGKIRLRNLEQKNYTCRSFTCGLLSAAEEKTFF